MAVDPDELDQIAATVAQVYQEAEVALVRLITRHLEGDLDRDIPSPQWATEKLAAVRALRRAAEAVVAGLTADSSREFAEAAAQAYRAGYGSALTELPKQWFPQSGIGEAAAAAAQNLPGLAAIESLAAAVHRDVGERSSNILRDVVDAYREVITAATSRMLTGAQTRRDAAQAAWRRLTDRGITGFVDRSGRRWKLSTYVEMATRTVTQRAAVQGQTDRLGALGVDLVMVSNAPQECVLCRPFEGRILSLNGPTGRIEVQHATRDDETVTVDVVATLDEARRDGLFHPQCRHSVSAYLPGISRPAPQPTADPEGDKAQQKQRAIERDIRRHKLAEVGALDETARKAARRKVAAAQARMREHLAEHPQLFRQRYRESIGAGNIPPKGRNDAAGDIGAVVQPTLDGGPAVPVQRAPRGERVAEAEALRQAEAEAAQPGPGQLDLLGEPGRIADALAAGRRKPADLSDDELRLADQEFTARAAKLGKPGQVGRTHQAVRDEIEQRAAPPAPEPEAPAAVELPDLAAVTDEQLDELLAEHADDDDAVEQILAELDRRQAEAEAAPADDDEHQADESDPHFEQWDHYEQLVSKGYTEENAYAEAFGKDVEKLRREEAIARLRSEGYKGRGLEELARAAWRDEVYRLYIQAEADTNGHMLTKQALARNLNPRTPNLSPLDLFTGPAHIARANASDELLEWWDTHGRMTYDQWLDGLLGKGPGYTGSAGDSWLR